MTYQLLPDTKVPVKTWAPPAEVELVAQEQLRATASLPWVRGVAVMPDVHWGKGATVGSVILSQGAVSPAVVGVDIGCGMSAVRTCYRADQLRDLAVLRHSVERAVPVGFHSNKTVTDRVAFWLSELGSPSATSEGLLAKAALQLGSLGGGNHFIEVCLDELGCVWVLLHTGSRHIGKALAERHLTAAKGQLARLFDLYDYRVDPELAALVVDTPEYLAYLSDVLWCQRYAYANRRELVLRVLRELSRHLTGQVQPPGALVLESVDCHHNYIEVVHDAYGVEGHALVTRKGAVSARAGEAGIVPGSMGTRSYVVRGKGSVDSYCSCAHGAGRRMSRGAARRAYTTADLVAETAGVECRKDDGVLDELPSAYKQVDTVMYQQQDLVEVTAVLTQVLCVKG